MIDLYGQRLLRAFTSAGVRFLVVGGHAMIYHRARRAGDANDLDLLLDPSSANIGRVREVLNEAIPDCWIPESFVKTFAQPGQLWNLKGPSYDFNADIMTPRRGVDFGPMYDSACSATCGTMEVRVPSRADLIFLKQTAVDRVRDDLAQDPRDASKLAALGKHQADLETLQTQDGCTSTVWFDLGRVEPTHLGGRP